MRRTCDQRLEMTLENACALIADCPHTTAQDEGVGYSLVRTPNIGYGRLVFDKMHRVSRAVYDIRNKRAKPLPGDLIYAREAPAGNVALIMPGQEVCLGQRTVLIRPNPEIVDSAFLTYYLLAPAQRNKLLGTATGATVAHVNVPAIRNLEISLPPLPTQKRMADVLSAYDDLIENNRRRMEILEESARLIFKERFGERETTGVLADICEEVRRSVKPSDVADDMPYIGLEHMPRRSISLCQWEGAGKVTSTKHGFNEGEILFGKIRPYFHKVGLAFVDGVASSDAIVIRPLKAELRNYVLLTVSSDNFVAAASQGMKEGSKMPRADWDLLLKYPVPIPAEKALANLNQLIEPIMQQLKALCFTNRKLAEARDVLLPKLMNETMGFDKGESK